MQLRSSLPARLLVCVAAVLVATGGITGAAAATTADADDRNETALEGGSLPVADALASGVAETTQTLDAVTNETTDAVDTAVGETVDGVDGVTNETTGLLANATGATESTDALENVTDETTDGLENATDRTTDGVDGVASETADATENASGDGDATGDENATDDEVVLLEPVTTGLEETVSFATTAVERTVGGTTGTVADAVSGTTTVVEETGATTVPGDDVRATSPLLADDDAAVADDDATVEDRFEPTDTPSSESTDGDGEDDDRPGPDSTATDAVLVGLLGAMTASGAAGAGASGAAGAGATGTATWLTQTGVVRSLRRALSALPLELVPILKYSRYDDSDPLENERRRAVYETVEAEPGCYLSRIADRSGVSLSTVRHHVRVLEDEGMLSAVKVNGKRRYFLEDADAELHAALEEPAKREVLEALEERGRAANGDLADALDRDPSTVSHHLSALEADGLVERERDGRSVVNELAPKVRTALLEEESAPGTDARATAPADD